MRLQKMVRNTGLLSCLLAMGLLAACGAKKDDAKKEDPKAGDSKGDAKADAKPAEGKPEEAAVPVQVATATQEPIHHLIAADAILYPINQANVMPKISSPVRRMLVNRGDHVKAGQILAELESRDLAAAVQESKGQYDQAQSSYQVVSGATVPEDKTKAQSDVNSAQQGLEAAKRVYESRVNLNKEGALAQKLVDDAKVALVQAQSQFDTAQRHLQSVQQVSEKQALIGSQAQVASAKAHYETAQAQLSYAVVRSPINGIVADRSVYAGEIAASGAAIVSVVDISQVVARANVSVKEAATLRPGRAATIIGPGGEVAGKVTVVSPSVDPNATTIQVWVQAGNKGEIMKPGATVRVSIAAETIKNAIVVPKSALLNFDEGGEKVMIYGSDGAAHERKVEVGITEGDKVQIVSGLKAGEQVITSGGLGLEDKAKVTVQKAEDDKDAKPEGKDAKKDDDEKK